MRGPVSNRPAAQPRLTRLEPSFSFFHFFIFFIFFFFVYSILVFYSSLKEVGGCVRRLGGGTVDGRVHSGYVSRYEELDGCWSFFGI